MKGYSYRLKNYHTNTSPTPDILLCDPIGASYDLYCWIIVHPWTKNVHSRIQRSFPLAGGNISVQFYVPLDFI